MKKIYIIIALLSFMAIFSCTDEEGQKTCTELPVVSAGEDQKLKGINTTTLIGVTDSGAGTWTIAEGEGGEIIVGDQIKFNGEYNITYSLRWEALNDCGSSEDYVNIEFNLSCDETLTINEMVDNIHWIEQACFRIESSNFTVYIDPNSITDTDVADVVLITHPHDDHYSKGSLDKIVGPNTILIAPEEVNYSGKVGKRIILKPGNNFEAYGCINIKAVPAYNMAGTWHKKDDKWVGYLITMDGITIYHSGDTGLIPEMKEFTCDIALLPLGQTYTFNSVEDAVQAAKDVQAKLAIPMHFGLYEGTLDDANKFKELLDGIIPVVIKVKGE